MALKHPKVKLIANALGTPPQDIIKEIHDSGRLVAALCGAAKQARAHQAAGIDIIIAQGTEGGGHTGDVGSMVLWPEVIEAVAPADAFASSSRSTAATDSISPPESRAARKRRARRVGRAVRALI